MKAGPTLIASFVLCSLVLPAVAQRISIYSEPTGSSSCIDAESGQFLPLYIVVHPVPGGAPELSSVRLRAPQPYCGVVYYNFLPVFPATTVGWDGVYTVDFEGCLSLPRHVLTVEAWGNLHTECCFIRIEPEGATDCGGTEVGMVSTDALVDTLCALIPPSNPYPADGAVEVPRSVVLTWDHADGPHYCSTVNWYGVYLGTTTDPPHVTMVGDPFYDPPGSLLPNTTYYWRIVGIIKGSTISSPLWSFTTTAGPVAVEQSTWGRIKALFR